MQLRWFLRLQYFCLAVLLPCVAAAQDSSSLARSGDLVGLQAVLPTDSDPDPETLVEPLYFASQRGHDEVVSYLLSLGAIPDSATNFGTALGIAARSNYTEIVASLLAAGADPNLPGGEYNMTALHHAAERGSMDAARQLLEHGADVNAKARSGWTPIHLAGLKERSEMVQFLRDMGAGPALIEPLNEAELKAADLEEGRVLAIQCSGCHGMAPDDNASGVLAAPNLFGIVSRPKASLEGFPYSKAMRAQTGRWTPEELNVFLADPFSVVPGTSMPLGSLPDRAARVAIIAYLTQLAH